MASILPRLPGLLYKPIKSPFVAPDRREELCGRKLKRTRSKDIFLQCVCVCVKGGEKTMVLWCVLCVVLLMKNTTENETKKTAAETNQGVVEVCCVLPPKSTSNWNHH